MRRVIVANAVHILNKCSISLSDSQLLLVITVVTNAPTFADRLIIACIHKTGFASTDL